MGVRLTSDSVCLVSGVMDGAAGVAIGDTGESLFSTYLRTSSLRTRPSLPVPVTSRMFSPWVLRRPRTAGVARDACLDFGVSVISSDTRGSVGVVSATGAGARISDSGVVTGGSASGTCSWGG